MTEDRNDDTVTDASLENAPEGDAEVSGDDKGADGTEAKPADAPEALTLEQVNKLTGRDFKDLESAEKGMKDTFEYVGKAGQVKKDLETELEGLKSGKEGDSQKVLDRMAAVEEELFFNSRPEVNRDVAKMVSKAKGLSLTEVIEDDSYKELAEKIKTADETEQAKSVLQSNPRLGGAEDRMSSAKESMKEAREALLSGDRGGSIRAAQTAEKSAVQAVIEAHDLEK